MSVYYCVLRMRNEKLFWIIISIQQKPFNLLLAVFSVNLIILSICECLTFFVIDSFGFKVVPNVAYVVPSNESRFFINMDEKKIIKNLILFHFVW